MKQKMVLLITLLMAVSVLAACRGGVVTLSDIPVYSGATLLQPGQDPIADTLVQNMEQDASLRGGLGVGGSMEQIAYRLPAGATWEQVKSFYDKELDAAGWKSGVGGPAGSMASTIMESANAGNTLFQTAIWSKGIGYKLSYFVGCQAINWLQFTYERDNPKIQKYSPAYTGYSSR
jgi:hypothetical protein